MRSEITRVSLIQRVRDPADQNAWRDFDAKYRELILRYCRARGVQPADADDVHQNVMSSLAQSLRKFEFQPGRARFRAYLGQVVRNAISRHMQRHGPTGPPLDTTVAAAVADSNDDDDALWEQEWTNHHYRLAMQTIRETFEPRSVQVFERILTGDAVDQIAAAFDTSAEAVNKIKQRVRARLEELIAQQIQVEDGNE